MKTKTSLFKWTLLSFILTLVNPLNVLSQIQYNQPNTPEYTTEGPDDDISTIFKICGGGVIPEGYCTNANFKTYFDEECATGYILINVYAVNLDQYSTADINGTYYWPHMQNLYVGVKENTEESVVDPIGPIEEFKHIGDTESGFPLFRSRIKVTTPSLENLNCHDQQIILAPERFDINIGVLTDGEEDTFMNFPIENYSYSTGVFSCEAFFENYVDCDAEGLGSSPSYSQDFEVCTYCFDCTEEGPSRGRSIDSENIPYAFPNPFSNKISLEINSLFNESGVLSLYSINSTLITSKKVRIQKGNNSLSLNTDELSKGVYYLNFQSDNYKKVFKIVKH